MKYALFTIFFFFWLMCSTFSTFAQSFNFGMTSQQQADRDRLLIENYQNEQRIRQLEAQNQRLSAQNSQLRSSPPQPQLQQTPQFNPKPLSSQQALTLGGAAAGSAIGGKLGGNSGSQAGALIGAGLGLIIGSKW